MAEETEVKTPESPAPAPPETQPDKIGDNGEGDKTDATLVSMPSDAFKKRLEREANSAINEFLKELGISDKTALSSLLESEKKRKEAEMSEAEKLTAKLAAKDAEIEAAKAQINALVTTQRNAALDARVLEIVADKEKAYNAVSPRGVLALLRTDPDAIGKMMDAEGKIDEKAIETAIEAIKKTEPELFRNRPQMPGSPSNHGGTPGTTNRDINNAALAQWNFVNSRR